MTRRTLLGTLISTASAQLRPAEGRAAADRALAALGGDRFQAMHHRLEKGRAYSFSHDQLSGLTRASFYLRYLSPASPVPASFLGVEERQALGKKEDVIYIYSDKQAVELTYRGARPLPEELHLRWKESQLHNVLYILHSRMAEPGITFDHKRSDILENHPADVIEIADSEGRAVDVWLDSQSHLPLRQQWTHRDPRTGLPIDEVTLFAKYRDIGGGIKWPYVVRRERNGTRIFEMYADTVAANPDLDNSLFEIPSGTKMLPPRP